MSGWGQKANSYLRNVALKTCEIYRLESLMGIPDQSTININLMTSLILYLLQCRTISHNKHGIDYYSITRNWETDFGNYSSLHFVSWNSEMDYRFRSNDYRLFFDISPVCLISYANFRFRPADSASRWYSLEHLRISKRGWSAIVDYIMKDSAHGDFCRRWSDIEMCVVASECRNMTWNWHRMKWITNIHNTRICRC